MDNKNIKKFDVGDVVKINGNELKFKIISFSYEENEGEEENVVEIDYWYVLRSVELVMNDGKEPLYCDARNEDILTVINDDSTETDVKEDIKSEINYDEVKLSTTTKSDKPKVKKKFNKKEADFMLDEYIKLMSLYEIMLSTMPSEAPEYKDKADEIMSLLNERGVEEKPVK